MKRTLFTQCTLLLALLIVAGKGQAYPGESVVPNANGDYILTYWDPRDPPGLETETFVPATKTAPRIQSSFRSGTAGEIVYRYAVANGSNGKQSIVNIFLEPVESVFGTRDTRGMKWGGAADKAARMKVLDANEKALATPNKWNGSVNFIPEEESRTLIRVSWITSFNLQQEREEEGVHPGGNLRGLGFSSVALPGIATAGFAGDAPVHIWSGEGPPEDSAIYDQVEEILWHNYVTRPAAIPTIAVPVPFDAAVLLDRIRTHVATWPDKKLLDPAFATQLDRTLVAAADAFRNNQPKAGREHIKSLRKLLGKEHKYLDHDNEDSDDTPEHKAVTRLTIDRLAARVLDFDLRYVLKRMEHGHEHENKGGHRKER